MKLHIGIAGAGFAGAVIARELAETGNYQITVFDERNHVAGNCHTYRDEETGIMLHQYGPHVFHTNREDVWDYMNRWGRFEPFVNRVKVHTKGGVYNLPINLLCMNQFFNKKMGPAEAKDFMGSISLRTIAEPKNYEDQALRLMGQELYQNFYYGLAKKQWGVDPKELPSSHMDLAPIRFNYDDNYYNQKFQGIPISGYTEIVKRILDHQNIEIRTGQKLSPDRKRDFDHVFWSGSLDDYFNYKLGKLNYRTLVFERIVENGDHQGNAVIYYNEEKVPYLRVTEHKHFMPWEEHNKTVCFKEYAKECGDGDIPFYPLRLSRDVDILKGYSQLAETEEKITFIGRLGTYRHLDMHTVIGESLDLAEICRSKDIQDWPRFSAYSSNEKLI